MSQRLKALLLTREYPPHVYGGAGVHVEYLARELARLVDVEVRCFGTQAGRSEGLQVRGYETPPGFLAEAPAALRGTLGTLARGLAFTATAPAGASVVHCHTWYSHLGGILCKLLHGLPLVVTIHSLEPLRPWKREQLGRGYDVSSWVERSALELADRIVAVSEGTREDVLRHFAVDPARIVVIPNGIDLAEYRPDRGTQHLERLGIPVNLPYVLFVGRITRQKGLVHLLRAARKLTPGVGLVLCAGAPDTRELGREVQEQVEALQRERGNVYWIPEMLSRPTVIQLYTRARVFCCPSVYEPFGIINLEAMACEAPVVASAVGGIKEVVVHEETGLLVELVAGPDAGGEPADREGFAASLAAALNRVLGDDALRARLGAAGRARVEARYAWSSVARELAALYASLATGASSEP